MSDYTNPRLFKTELMRRSATVSLCALALVACSGNPTEREIAGIVSVHEHRSVAPDEISRLSCDEANARFTCRFSFKNRTSVLTVGRAGDGNLIQLPP